MMNIPSRSAYAAAGLARLMAGENLSIVHDRKATTASIDLAQRKLHLPIWKDISPQVYDMFVGHEIGHAKYTPAAGWHKGIVDGPKGIHGYQNVVEDARIERKIKEQYPGLVRVFTHAYRELLDRDFFRIKKKTAAELNDMLLVDRINIYFKCGAIVPISFTPMEQLVVRRVASVESWNDVVILSRLVYAIDKRRGRHDAISITPHRFGAPSIEGDEQEYDVAGEQSEDGDSSSGDDTGTDLPDAAMEKMIEEMLNQLPPEPDHFDDLNKKAPDKLDEETSVMPESDEPPVMPDFSDKTDNGFEPESETDKAFRDSEETVVDADQSWSNWTNDEQTLLVPDFDLGKFIVPHKRLHDILTKQLAVRNYTQSVAEIQTEMQAWLRTEQKIINHLVCEFEMRKNASQYARAGTAKTGEINLKKLANYRLVDDIFARTQKLPDGKNHGLVLMFDQSSSMTSQMFNVVKQLIVLTEFCRKMSIPYTVYGFCDNTPSFETYLKCSVGEYSYPEFPKANTLQLANSEVHLKQYLSSDMSGAEYKRAILNLWRVGKHIGVNDVPAAELMGGTPLNSALVLSGQLINEFRKSTRTDVVNFLLLTDGEATDNLGVNVHATRATGETRLAWNGYVSAKFTKDYGQRMRCTAVTTDLMKRATGANYIGLFLPYSNLNAANAFNRYNGVCVGEENGMDWKRMNRGTVRATFAREGFMMTNNYGFTGFFFAPPLNEAKELNLNNLRSGSTTREMSKQLSAVGASKIRSRAFLSVFVSMIA